MNIMNLNKKKMGFVSGRKEVRGRGRRGGKKDE